MAMRDDRQPHQVPKEEWDAITINVEGTVEEVQRNVVDAVTDKLAEYPQKDREGKSKSLILSKLVSNSINNIPLHLLHRALKLLLSMLRARWRRCSGMLLMLLLTSLLSISDLLFPSLSFCGLMHPTLP
jgi:hypothetical protein